MAVYEHAYSPYTGPLTPRWSRFAIIPRHAIREVFRSKLLTGVFAVSFVYPLVAAILIYLHHNVNALSILDLPIKELLPIDTAFFRNYVSTQARFAFLITLFVGPTLISSDLANNGLPLYLARPFTRLEYVVGKLTVVVALLSAVTWAPGLLLIGLQAYIEGGSWLAHHLPIVLGVFAGSWMWILVLSMLALAVSAFVKWTIAARAALFGAMIVPSALATVINQSFQTTWGSIVSPSACLYSILVALFGSEGRVDIPAAAALVSIVLLLTVCAGALALKIKAYEVIR